MTSVAPEDFYDEGEKGSIILKKSQSFSFCRNGLIIESESSPLATDMVIFGTGFKADQKLIGIFESPAFQKYIKGPSVTTVPLYKFQFRQIFTEEWDKMMTSTLVGHWENCPSFLLIKFALWMLGLFGRGGEVDKNEDSSNLSCGQLSTPRSLHANNPQE